MTWNSNEHIEKAYWKLEGIEIVWLFQDFVLPTECVNFCQPDGCKVIQMKKGRNKEINSFAFTLTDKDSGKQNF